MESQDLLTRSLVSTFSAITSYWCISWLRSIVQVVACAVCLKWLAARQLSLIVRVN